jgi:hypothetical protein
MNVNTICKIFIFNFKNIQIMLIVMYEYNIKYKFFSAIIKNAHLPFITAHFTSLNTAHIYSIVKKENLKDR